MNSTEENIILLFNDYLYKTLHVICNISVLIVCLLFPLQYPTPVRTCAATSVSSGPAATPAPAHRAPLRSSLTPMNVTQVNCSLSSSAACTLVLTVVLHLIVHPLIPSSHVPGCSCVILWCHIIVVDSVSAWPLLLQPLRHLLQCPLHVDA